MMRRPAGAGLRAAFGVAVALALVVATTAPVRAQDYPNRSIRVIVSNAAGGVTDVLMRASAAELNQRLGQTLVIENRGGASGIPAADACAHAKPDGYTICLVNHGQLSINPLEFAKLPYDADTDFAPIAHLYFLVEALFVPSKLNINSIGELKAVVKARPGSFNYGTLGAGSFPDLFLQWLNHEWDSRIVGIPYRGGGPIAQAIVAGELQLAKMGVGNFLGPLEAKQVKALAVAAPVRSPLLPGVPTLDEVGLPFPSFGWWGVAAPRGTPQPIIERLAAEFIRLGKEPKMIAIFDKNAVVPSGMGPAEFAAFLKADRERARKLLAYTSHSVRDYTPESK